MKAAKPVGPYGTFSATDWEEIRQSLAKIGIDANTARVSAHFESGTAPHKGGRIYRYSSSKHRWLLSGPDWRLSDVLQQLAYFYTLPKPPTAKQRRAELEATLTAVEEARARLRSAETKRLYNYPDIRPSVTKDRTLNELLTWKIAELQERITALHAIGSSSKQSALTVQGDYWRELTELWRACGDGRLHENALRQFLLACSRAPFAEMNTEKLDEKIDSFLSHQSHSQKRQSQTTP